MTAIYGRVTDSITGVGIYPCAVTVEYPNYSCMTNWTREEDGVYLLDILAGEISLEFSAEGYIGVIYHGIRVPANSIQRFDAAIPPIVNSADKLQDIPDEIKALIDAKEEYLKFERELYPKGVTQTTKRLETRTGHMTINVNINTQEDTQM
jgi:hypothetical protein